MPSPSQMLSAEEPSCSAELDHVEVVLDRRLASSRVGGGHRPELVGDRAVARRRRVVLERVRVHRVEAEPERLGVLAQGRDVVRLVPRHVQADRPVRTGEGVQRRDVVELLLDRPRLAAAGKAAEAGAAGAERPGGSGDAEAPHLLDHALGVDALELEQRRRRREGLFVPVVPVGLERRDRLCVQLHLHTSRLNGGMRRGCPRRRE